MTKRICWKKGMRLTDYILRASDNLAMAYIDRAFALAVAGRFGLLPESRPFDITLNISKGMIDVESLSCLALTKGGEIIDTHFDTRYTNVYETRVQIPEENGEKEFILIINIEKDQWKETNDGYEEPVYSFSLISVNQPVPDNSVPIGRIVNEFGWRMDDIDFVPPCLYVSSHPKYVELLEKFSEVLKTLDLKVQKMLNSNGKEAFRIFWPIIQQLIITIDKERDAMTPMVLLGNVQKCVSAFTCACVLDEYLNLADADAYRNYVFAPYSYKNAYQLIKEGLEICFSVCEKVDKMQAQPKHEPMDAPVILPNDLSQECITPETELFVSYPKNDATIYFTVDGSTPTKVSNRAQKTRNGYKLKFDNGYRKEKGKEADKKLTIKLIAIRDNDSSSISNYVVSLHKSLKFRDAIPI